MTKQNIVIKEKIEQMFLGHNSRLMMLLKDLALKTKAIPVENNTETQGDIS